MKLESDPFHQMIGESMASEKSLVQREEQAERQLAKAANRARSARIRLDRAQARMDRRQKQFDDATSELKDRQEARAAGPDRAELAVPAYLNQLDRPPDPD
ncbi:hypothetical protein BH23CHL5_BH23CHL5_15330 [soil metagenome]